MDWSKAKTILIIALLVTCLALGLLILSEGKKQDASDRRAALAAEEYLKEQGVSSICDIPLKRPQLPVLFVSFFNMTSSAYHKSLNEYKGYPIILETSEEIAFPYMAELKSIGKTKAKVCTASSALLSACATIGNLKNTVIKEINLVYYIQLSEVSDKTEDTALPHWQIVTDKGSFYVNAFGQ